MRRVTCYDCKRTYDFDVDDFCPKCGAFTQPPHRARIGADGSVVSVEGNRPRKGASFAGAERHQENRQRKHTGLEWASAAKSPLSANQDRWKTVRQEGGRAMGGLAEILKGLLLE